MLEINVHVEVADAIDRLCMQSPQDTTATDDYIKFVIEMLFHDSE